MRRSSFSLILALVPVIWLSWPSMAFGGRVYAPGEVIVKLKGKSISAESTSFIGKAVSLKGMSLKKSWGALNMHHFALKPGEDVLAKIDELKKDPAVEYAEPNFIVSKADLNTVTGQQAYAQGIVTGQSYGNYGLSTAPIEAAEAWSVISTGSQLTTVAVIDTGIDFNHSVFTDSGAIWTNPNEIASNGLDDDHNGYVDDVHGWNFAYNNNNPQDDDNHGTHVSGIILGTTELIFQTPTPAAKIRIMPLKFLDSTGTGQVSDAVSAIYYAVNNGAKVLNNSWGGTDYSQALLDAITYAYDHQTVFVAAAGNNGSNNDRVPLYPANYNVPNVISVAATTTTDQLASFSDYGPSTVHVGSPGVSVYSTLPGNTFGFLSGTSMATPFVSGMAALMAREAPTMTGWQIKQLILSGANQVTGLVGLVNTQARINVLNSVQLSQTTPVSSQPVYIESTSGSRDPASAPAGCGLVAKLGYDNSDFGAGGDSASPMQVVLFLIVILMPIGAYVVMRALMPQPVQRRRYDRFRIDSSVRVKVGDQELVGNVSSISLGGVQLNTDAMLKDGGIVTLLIKSPDGNQEIQAEGRIVWSAAQKHYGIAFSDAQESLKQAIREWTRSLVPSAAQK